jgi:hypothetical protein
MSNLRLINETSGTSISQLTITDLFTDDYDIYYFTITDFDHTGNAILKIQFVNSAGSVVTATEYDYANLMMQSWTSYLEYRLTNSNDILYAFAGSDITAGMGGYQGYIFNPTNSSSYTFMLGQASTQYDFGGTDTGFAGNKMIGLHKSAEKITGLNFRSNIGTTEQITVRTYGLRVDS